MKPYVNIGSFSEMYANPNQTTFVCLCVQLTMTTRNFFEMFIQEITP